MRCIIIKSNNKEKVNQYETKENITYLKVSKKNGEILDCQIDTEDLEKVLEKGNWFAQWHKDFNSYLVQNVSLSNTNGKKKNVKQTLHSFILGVSPKAPIRHINGDTLDNRKCNLEVYSQNVTNDYEIVDENTVSIILRDKFGQEKTRAIIDKEDLDKVLAQTNGWVYYKHYDKPSVISNTPDGRIYLDRFIMDTDEKMIVHHINLNTLDNRKSNLENKVIPDVKKSKSGKKKIKDDENSTSEDEAIFDNESFDIENL